MIQVNPTPMLIGMSQAEDGDSVSATDFRRRVKALQDLIPTSVTHTRYLYLTEREKSLPVQPRQDKFAEAIEQRFNPSLIFVCGENLEGEVKGTFDILRARFSGKVTFLPDYSFESRF